MSTDTSTEAAVELARTPEPPYYAVIFASRRHDDEAGGPSDGDIAAWKSQAEHLQAQRLGHAQWYADFELRIARVERAYGMHRR